MRIISSIGIEIESEIMSLFLSKVPFLFAYLVISRSCAHFAIPEKSKKNIQTDRGYPPLLLLKKENHHV